MRWGWASAIGLTLAAGLAGSAFAQGRLDIPAKAGGTEAERSAVQKDCAAFAEKTRANIYDSKNPFGNGMVGSMLIAGLSDGSIVADATTACMAERGWAWVTLTKPEYSALIGLQGKRRAQWLDDFYASGIETRVAAAMPPPFTPLPPLRQGPWLVGGVKLDGAQMTLAAGPVGPKQALVSGVGGYAGTARLTQPLSSKFGPNTWTAPVGTVFHQIDYQLHGAGYWCGELTGRNITGTSTTTWCFTNLYKSYYVNVGWQRRWLVATFPNPAGLKTVSPMALEVMETTSPIALDWTLDLLSLKAQTVLLRAMVRHDGKELEVWRGELAWDASGQARLPCWDRALVLTRSGKTLTAAWADGDGTGWPASLPTAPAQGR